MRKEDLIRRITDVMIENGTRKSVSFPKHTFHISDDDGNVEDFVVKQSDKMVRYTAKDVRTIIDTCIYVIKESLKSGEGLVINGICSLDLIYKKPLPVKNIHDGKKIIIPGHYAPKIVAGPELKRCVQVYEQRMKDEAANTIEPIPDELDEDE